MGKICILLPTHWDAGKGGAEYQADQLAQYICHVTKHQVIYLARNIDDSSEAGSYEVYKIPRLFQAEKFGLFWDSVALYKKLVDINPDIVWQHVGCAYTGVSAYYCKKKHKSLIWHIASDVNVERKRFSFSPKKIPIFIDNLFLSYGIKNATRVIAQTKYQSEIFRKNYGRTVDAIISNFHSVPRVSFHKTERFTVLWVANFKKLKQPEIFLKLANDCTIYDNVIFKMIGRKEKSEWCDSLIQQIESIDNLEYLGEMELEEVNSELEKAHILVNTSEYEGFPNTFIQAWMREVLTLSLNVDPDGVITKNEIGLFAGNYKNMKNYIIHMSENQYELARIGKHARQFAEENFSMKNADEVIEVIEEELNKVSV